jgi:uncharacterized protein
VIVYVDSSVLLRIVLHQPKRLREWRRISRAISSELIRLECLRTIDRARIRLGLPDSEVSRLRSAMLEQLDGFELVEIDAPILDRAAQPFPTLLGSLDAVHLATALRVADQEKSLTVASHDGELSTAARSMGFAVIGS